MERQKLGGHPASAANSCMAGCGNIPAGLPGKESLMPQNLRTSSLGDRTSRDGDSKLPKPLNPEGGLPRSSVGVDYCLLAAGLLWATILTIPIFANPGNISFSQSAPVVDACDFVEVTLNVAGADAKNPFTEVVVEGQFGKAGDSKRLSVDGFCDAADGSVFRIRFMPTSPGDYSYAITYRQDGFTKDYSGTFRAVNGHRRGLVRVDPNYRWHFIWEGTGEHYFWNGTTTYWLMGWDDEKVIKDSIDRLHALKVNRLRVLIAGRSAQFWSEPIVPGMGFRICLNPWVAERPDDVSNPGYDFTRYNLPYWQKYERMLTYTRARDMVVSVIFDINDSKSHPADSGEDERRYFRYGVARLAAYSNVTWDLGNEFDAYHKNPDAWANNMGTLLKKWDVYHHLTSAHSMNNRYQYRTSEWFDMTLVQWWPRPLHEWMLGQRQEQARTGRIIPQANEEYGYEDHYPRWSPSYPDGASADANRRAAWQMAMAGTYQTTGETAKRGTGAWPDTGGGWLNGRGDDTMVMLKGYAHMLDFFTSFEWWKTEPHDELVNNGAFCLAEPGKLYAVYLPNGGDVTVNLEPGTYQASWFNARNGEALILSKAKGAKWTSPVAPDSGDWALLLKR
jgi:hypothetical protein